MSFRSRSHTKPVAPPRRRSSSLTRNAGASSASYSSRPISIHGSSLGGNYTPQSSYSYGSNQNLRMGGNDYGNNSFDARRNSYGTSLNGMLKFPLTTMNTSVSPSYVSPYKDRYSQSYYGNSGSNSGSGSSGYVSAYKDRSSSYYKPYSSYDNGVTTAGLSFQMSNPKRDYRTNLLSTSTGNLNVSKGSSMNASQSINEKVASIGRSQSLREQERKSRSRKCKEAVKAAVPDTQIPYDPSGISSTLSSAQKSVSSLSLQSEGYEVKISQFLDFSFSKLQNNPSLLTFSFNSRRSLKMSHVQKRRLHYVQLMKTSSSITRLSMKQKSKW